MDPKFLRFYDYVQDRNELGQSSNQPRGDDGSHDVNFVFGAGPQKHHQSQERAQYYGFDSNPFGQTVSSRSDQEYRLHNPLVSDALQYHEPYQASASLPTPRMSLGPPDVYSQPQTRSIANAENHFKVMDNLRNGAPFQSARPPIPTASYNRMPQPSNIQPPRSLSLELADPEAIFPGRHQSSRFDQPQTQNYRDIPSSFNYNALSPRSDPINSHTNTTSLYQHSSPLARLKGRRSATRSQPALPSLSYDSTPQHRREAPRTPHKQTVQSAVPQTPQTRSRPHAPPITNHGIQLVSLQALPDRLRKIFPYDLFNAVQSKCFEPVYNTNDNIVVSAPTGSGKTAILELAICRLISSHSNSGQFKIVYQAPIKSLCSERMQDWEKKFASMNLICAELTGDTSVSEMSKVRDASIIVTTPEKWDSITRKWKDHVRLLQMVKLFLIDEVHILNDPRGATLEAVVSRMKTIGANVRFVALSATVPNSEDVAIWLGKDHTNNLFPAHREIFGEEFRPVKLQKFVHGYESKPNDFIFDNSLSKRLPHLIAKCSHKKPIMVFCFTKTSCEKTATLLAEWWSDQSKSERAWPAPVKLVPVMNKDLHASVSCGVAFHHAGLDSQDRHAIEKGFLEGNISVICCTSTLAMGINLPCHSVVLKGTTCYKDTGPSEYSDLEVMQMLGRAGRPQFDDSGVAIIMTRHEQVDRYTRMISGQEMLESKLHLNLIGHLNSEIGLGTVRDISTAKKWLSGTFLNVRMRQNPNYYKIDGIGPGKDTEERLERVCERDIKLLQNHKLITNGNLFETTEYGDAMSRYMVPFETMQLLLSIPGGAKVEDILHTLCKAVDFKDLKMRPNERAHLRELNKSCFMKFPVKEAVSTVAHKVFVIIQVQLGGIDLPSNENFTQFTKRQFMSDKTIIFERMQRFLRCVIDCKAHDCDAITTRNALDLVRAISAGFWENSSLQLRQVPQIGPVAMLKLASNNVKTVRELADLGPAGIERVVGRNPPFGSKLHSVVKAFPVLKLVGEVMGKVPSKAGEPVNINIRVKLRFMNENMPVWKGRIPGLVFIAETSNGTLIHFWRGSLKNLDNGFELKFTAQIPGPDSKVLCQIACDDIVGTVHSVVLEHHVPASAFPTPKPSPLFRQQRIESPPTEQEQVQNEFDEDGFEDDDLLAAVENAERITSNEDCEEFEDIDEILISYDRSTKQEPLPSQKVEPARMPNGKFACNHPCRAGKLLKNGKTCKHPCCHEGLNKPRKATNRKSSGNLHDGNETEDTDVVGKCKPASNSNQATGKKSKSSPAAAPQKLKAAKHSNKYDKNIEYIDLEDEDSPASYSAPDNQRKHNRLHTEIEKNKSILHKAEKLKSGNDGGKGLERSNDCKPTAATAADPFEDDFFDNDSLPSPTKLLRQGESQNEVIDWDLEDIARREDDSFRDYGLSSHYDMGQDEDLEAALIGLDDSLKLHAQNEDLPLLSPSFVEGVFDFSSCLPSEKSSVSSPPFRGSLKREANINLGDEKPEIKRHRATGDGSLNPEKPIVSAWDDGPDADLFKELRNIVDFVD